MAITMTQLRSYLAVVEAGSVTGAAEQLYVTQPSVSAAVSALSKELGVDLTEHIQFVIDALKPHAEALGLARGAGGAEADPV